METNTDENAVTDITSFAAIANSDTPILLTGEDGTIYQVAGQNEDGQTILISQGPDGQQQCVLVASDGSGEDGQALAGAEAATDSEQAEQQAHQEQASEEGEGSAGLEQSEGGGEVGEESAEGGDGEDSQVVAQIIKADPPSPGKTHNVFECKKEFPLFWSLILKSKSFFENLEKLLKPKSTGQYVFSIG